MRSLKSLAAYAFAGVNTMFALGCTEQQQQGVHDFLVEMDQKITAYFSRFDAWQMLEKYEAIDGGYWKDYLKDNYKDYIRKAAVATEEGDFYFNKPSHTNIINGDTLKSTLLLASNGLIEVEYDLPNKGHAKISYMSELQDNPFPESIDVEETTRIGQKLRIVDTQSFVSKEDSVGREYVADYRSTEFYGVDTTDQETVVEAIFHSYVEDSLSYDVTMTVDNKGEPLKVFDQVGFRLIDPDNKKADKYGYVVDTTATFHDFLNAAKRAVHNETETAEADSVVESALLYYKDLIDRMPKKTAEELKFDPGLEPVEKAERSNIRPDMVVPGERSNSQETEDSGLYKLIALPVQQRRLQM